MNAMMQWFETITSGETINAVSTRSGLVDTTLRRQVRGGVLAAETVLAIARAYNENGVEALIQCGFVTSEEADEYASEVVFEGVSDQMLADEVLRRLHAGRGPIDRPEEVA